MPKIPKILAKSYDATMYCCPCGFQVSDHNENLVFLKSRLHKKKCSKGMNKNIPTFIAQAEYGETEHSMNVEMKLRPFFK
jgi:hypothetical protein